METTNSLIQLIEESIRKNWNLDAMTDYKGATLQYKDVARKIEKMHILLEHAGIKKGDKIALCGRNSANWTATFLGVITYGAVAVPILHEFKADNVHNIVNHSEARMLFVGDQVWENFNEAAMPHLEGIIELKNFDLVVSRSEQLTYAREHLNEEFGKRYPCRSVQRMFLTDAKSWKSWPSSIILRERQDIQKVSCFLTGALYQTPNIFIRK